MNPNIEILAEILEPKSSNTECGHYTSIDSFVNICNTFHLIDNLPFLNIWFSNAYNTNDKQEASLGYDFMMDSFSEIESCLKHRDKRLIISNYEEELNKSTKFKKNTPEQIREWLTHEKATPYIMSMTRKIDNIDMWIKSYGHDGKGVCLVFDFIDMDSIRYQSDFFVHGPFSVVYGDRLGYLNEKNMLKSIVRNEYSRFIKDVIKINSYDEILERKIKAMDQVCSLISSFIKGEMWHNESEERMVALRHFIPTKDEPKIIKHHNRKEYLEVEIPVSCLKKIYVGPCSDNTAIRKVKDNAARIGLLSENVIVSNLPLQ